MQLARLAASALALSFPASAAHVFLEPGLSPQPSGDASSLAATTKHTIKELSRVFPHKNTCEHTRTPPACTRPGPGSYSAHLVVSSFLEDVHWLNEMDWDDNITVLIHDRAKDRTHDFHMKVADSVTAAEASEAEVKKLNIFRKRPVEFVDIPNKGDEGAAYLSWIIQKYYKLPEVVFFVQGHRCSNHANFDMSAALPSLRRCFDKSKGYLDINAYREGGATQCRETNALMEHPITGLQIGKLHDLWLDLFQQDLGAFPRTMCWDGFAQFAVTRERLQKHPVDFYKRLFKNAYHGNTTMEFFWRMLFVPDAIRH